MKIAKISLTIITLIQVISIIHAEGIWTQYTNNDGVYDFAVHGDYIWCTSFNKIVRWNRIDGTYKIIDDFYGTIHAIDKYNRVWFYDKNDKMIKFYDGNSITSFPETAGYWITDIAFDKEDIVWIGTRRKEVLRYDWSSWEKVPIRDKLSAVTFWDIFVDENNDKWFGTYGGVLYYDGVNWTAYPLKEGSLGLQVYSCSVDHNDIKWFCTEGGIMSFDGTNWTTYNFFADKVIVDNNNVKWFASIVKGLGKYDGDTWEWYTTDNSGIPGNSIGDIAVDDDGVLWLKPNYQPFFYNVQGLTCFDGTTWKTFKTWGPAHNIISCAAVDRDNVKWFGTRDGVSRFDGTTWTTYTVEDELTKQYVDKIWIDTKNVKWFMNYAGGLMSFDGETVTICTQENTARQRLEMCDLAIDSKGNEWYLTPHGVSCFDGTQWTDYTTADWDCTSDFTPHTMVADTSDVLWIAMDSGVLRFDGETWTRYDTEVGFTNIHINSIDVSNNNIKWFGTWGNGLWSYNGKQWLSHFIENNEAEFYIKDVVVDDNDVKWISAVGIPEFYRYYGTKWTANENIGEVKEIVVDHDNVTWVASSNGVWSYSDSSPISVEEKNAAPGVLTLDDNYPNPFNSVTTLSFTLPVSGKASLIIYSITGQKVTRLIDGYMVAGRHSTAFDCANLSSGVYIYSLTMDGFNKNGKMTLVR